MTERICTVDDCGRPLLARGLCQAHYDRLRRYGDVNLVRSVECEACGEVFRLGQGAKRRPYCPPCQADWHRKRTRERRHHNSMKAYGLTPNDYARMAAEQGGVCAICGGLPNGKGASRGRLSVDHDHATGKVRALLCSKCNTGIGLLNDSPDLLMSAAAYVIQHSNTHSPI